MTPAEIRWSITANVTVTTPDGTSIPRGVPTFEVWASSSRSAYTKAKNILTCSWSGPSKVTMSLGMCDEKANYFSADEKGIKE